VRNLRCSFAAVYRVLFHTNRGTLGVWIMIFRITLRTSPIRYRTILTRDLREQRIRISIEGTVWNSKEVQPLHRNDALCSRKQWATVCGCIIDLSVPTSNTLIYSSSILALSNVASLFFLAKKFLTFFWKEFSWTSNFTAVLFPFNSP